MNNCCYSLAAAATVRLFKLLSSFHLTPCLLIKLRMPPTKEQKEAQKETHKEREREAQKEIKELKAKILEEAKGSRETRNSASSDRRRSEVAAGLKKHQTTLDNVVVVESPERQESVCSGESVEAMFKSLEKKLSNVPSKEYLQTEFKKIRDKVDDAVHEGLDKIRKDIIVILEKELESIKSQLATLETNASELNKTVEALKSENSDMQTDIDRLKADNTSLKEKNRDLTEKINDAMYGRKVNEMKNNDLEQYTRRNSVRIYGLEDPKNKEEPDETAVKVIQTLNDKLHIRVDVRDIDIAHRMGAFRADGNRPVICKFVSRMLKTRIIRERRKLKGTKIVIRDDLTLKNQKLLEETSAVSNVKSVWSDNGKIIALLDTGRKVVVDLKTDLSKPIGV